MFLRLLVMALCSHTLTFADRQTDGHIHRQQCCWDACMVVVLMMFTFLGARLRFFASMISHDQKQVGKERVSWLIRPDQSSLLKELRTGTQTGQEPGGRSRCRSHGRELLLACFSFAAQPTFLENSG